jgi:hypothetical protein
MPPTGPAGEGSAAGYPFPENWLTKRELFAALALQGLLAHPRGPAGEWKKAGADAVLAADALIEALTDEMESARRTTLQK